MNFSSSDSKFGNNQNVFLEKIAKGNTAYIAGNIIITLVVIARALFLLKANVISKPLTMIIVISVLQEIFFAMGWWYIAAYRDKLKKNRANCTQTVAATLVDYKVVVHSDEDGTTYTYYGKYEYSWNGVNYYTTSKTEYVGKREKNVQCKLLINPKDPEEIYEVELEADRIVSKRITGIIIMLFGCLFFRV